MQILVGRGENSTTPPCIYTPKERFQVFVFYKKLFDLNPMLKKFQQGVRFPSKDYKKSPRWRNLAFHHTLLLYNMMLRVIHKPCGMERERRFQSDYITTKTLFCTKMAHA